MNSEWIDYYAEQPQYEVKKIIAEMTSLLNKNEYKMSSLKRQDWFQRMIKTVSGKNEITQEEIRRNHDKLNAYMTQVISHLYNRVAFDEKFLKSLHQRIAVLTYQQNQLKIMLSAFVEKLNNKIDSVDNFHMLIEEIRQGVYQDEPIIAICNVITQLDAKTLRDSRKMDIIQRELEDKNILNDNKVSLTAFLESIIRIPNEDIGCVYMTFYSLQDSFLARMVVHLIEEYHFLPSMEKEFKDVHRVIEDTINSEQLDHSKSLSIRTIYDEFVKYTSKGIVDFERSSIEVEEKIGSMEKSDSINEPNSSESIIRQMQSLVSEAASEIVRRSNHDVEILLPEYTGFRQYLERKNLVYSDIANKILAVINEKKRHGHDYDLVLASDGVFLIVKGERHRIYKYSNVHVHWSKHRHKDILKLGDSEEYYNHNVDLRRLDILIKNICKLQE